MTQLALPLATSRRAPPSLIPRPAAPVAAPTIRTAGQLDMLARCLEGAATVLEADAARGLERERARDEGAGAGTGGD